MKTVIIIFIFLLMGCTAIHYQYTAINIFDPNKFTIEKNLESLVLFLACIMIRIDFL